MYWRYLENSEDLSAFFNLLLAVDARVAYEKGEPWQSLRTLAKACYRMCRVLTAGLAGFGSLQVCSQASKKQLQVIKTRWMMAAMAGSILHLPLFVILCDTLGQRV